MSTVRRQTTEAAGGAVLSRQTVEAAALYNGCAEELRRALHGTEGAAKRWAEHRRQGLTNDELKHAIGRQWGMDYGADSPGKGFRTKGGKNPRFWLGFYARANDKPTLQGPALVAAVRELLQIPKPKEAAAALAPAAVDLDPRSVTCPQCAAPAGSPCKRPSGHVIPFGEVHAPRRAALVAANLPPAEKAAREAHIRSIIDEDRPRPPAVAPEPAAPAITMLAVEQIRRSPLNPRTTFDEAALAELAASIEQSGLLQPLVVRPVGYGYELLAGERRLRACLKTCLAQVPCIVREGVSDEEALSLMLVENLQRADLNPIEEASAYAQLSEMGMTQEQIAARVGRSRPAVANAIRLLKLPEAVKAMVAGGQITAAHGAALLHWATPAKEKKCLRLADSARKGYYSSKSLEDQARYDIQEEKRREERKAREAEAGAKGGAAVATGPTWQELEAQRDAERRSQRDARQPVVAELAEALREAREAGPILEDRRAMAVLASRMMGRALGLLTETLHQAGHGDLADYFDWSKHSFADRYEALAQLDAETLLTLAFRVEMAEELRGFAEWDQGRPSIDWYLGLPDEEEPSIDEEDDQGDGVPA